MSYQLALHTDTDNYHIHFSFIEKAPNYIYKNGNINYRRQGKITQDEQNFLKRMVLLAIERESIYKQLLIKTNTDIDELKRYFNPKDINYTLNNKKDILLEDKIIRLGALLSKYHNNDNKKIKYNSIKNNDLGKEIKRLTRDIKKSLFNDKDSELYKKQDDINNSLKSINDYFNKINEDNKVFEIIKNNSIVNYKEEYINNYILNSIVNHSLYKYNNTTNNNINITVDDVIKGIVYINTKDITDKDNRLTTLNNYFKGRDYKTKFIYKNKIERVFRNINYEMEQAKDKFSELFEKDKSKKFLFNYKRVIIC